MNKRQKRLEIIADMLTHNTVGSQEELLALLVARQIYVTQATLSRDLKALRTSKVSTEKGGYRYVTAAPAPADTADNAAAAKDPSRQDAVSYVARAGNIVILKTPTGYAGSIASDLDLINSPLIAGTVAGTDTVFVALADDASLAEVYDLLCSFLPEKTMLQCHKYFFPTT